MNTWNIKYYSFLLHIIIHIVGFLTWKINHALILIWHKHYCICRMKELQHQNWKDINKIKQVLSSSPSSRTCYWESILLENLGRIVLCPCSNHISYNSSAPSGVSVGLWNPVLPRTRNFQNYSRYKKMNRKTKCKHWRWISCKRQWKELVTSQSW